MIGRDRRAGTTVLETLVASAVLSVVVTALFLALDQTGRTSIAGDRIATAAERSSRLRRALLQDLLETGLSSVDTASRDRVAAAPGGDWTSNHFAQTTSGLAQCPSPVCGWNTTPDGDALGLRSEVAENRLVDAGGESIARRGRPWLDGGATCPLDGTPLAAGAVLDTLLLLSPRGPDGSFVTEESTAADRATGQTLAPDGQAIVLYFPFHDVRAGRLELRRLVLYRQDLVSADVPSTDYQEVAASQSGWSAWSDHQPAGEPTLVDLLDFGTDGTLDGQPDGSIPTTADRSDADRETFALSVVPVGNQEIQYLVRTKILDSHPTRRREHSIIVDRATGEVTWTVDFEDLDTGSAWYRHVRFVRRPEVVGRGLVALDISTPASNPWSLANPRGVAPGGGVRVTILQAETAGESIHEHELRLDILPRHP